MESLVTFFILWVLYSTLVPPDLFSPLPRLPKPPKDPLQKKVERVLFWGFVFPFLLLFVRAAWIIWRS